ncbi:NADPH:quinone oxidoreductase family protein [Rhodococcus sp. IEGM 1366]|uniref:NADPH:quinone oxidoreductase family protein n=1 Tax=Rhodococcus sp. IEGM 1366 TaxID=3082223 RepID=UPI0029544E0F|nr:NADPH:quinone oxidoreductase family protein [Rhodococcus sp. IEGM 1366]MDV8070921.1 NADPH:quinone oxidoreductase family protein [Rhodococcus sp. IEGM 1366]
MTSTDRTFARALQICYFGETPKFVVREVPYPNCGPREVVVAPRFAAIHFADVLMMRGQYQLRLDLPFVPGMEAAGRVVSVGCDVTHVARGDRVLAVIDKGAFAEAFAVPAPQVARIPESMTYSTAATFGITYFTAYAALHFRARIRAGETVLVTGVRGNVGRAVVQLAKNAGATVLAVSRDPEQASAELGPCVDHVVDADPDALVDTIKHITSGGGADVVVDVVGGPLLAQLARAVAWEGRLVVAGFASGTPAPIKPGHLLVKNIAVMGLQSTDYWYRHPEKLQAAWRELLALADEGVLQVEEPRVFAFGDVRSAMSAVDEGTNGSVAIRIGANSL